MQGDDWPDGMEMIRQLREAAGLFAGAMPITPQKAWEDALAEVRQLREVTVAARRWRQTAVMVGGGRDSAERMARLDAALAALGAR